MIKNLEQNKFGIHVWHHYFDFEYRDTLVSPWYSGLAQGMGLSVLTRAYNQTEEEKYLDAIFNCLDSMQHAIEYSSTLSKEKYFLVKFEDLVSDRMSEMEKICKYLDIEDLSSISTNNIIINGNYIQIFLIAFCFLMKIYS